MIYVIMGVSGSGKSSIGQLLSDELGLQMYDADDFHSKENIAKMASGSPLQDEDRWDWLESVRSEFPRWSQEGAILACSMLRESYRKFLMEVSVPLTWIFLDGSFELVLERLESRSAHFMKPSMLRSQFETLEIPEYGIHVSIDNTPHGVLLDILEGLAANE